MMNCAIIYLVETDDPDYVEMSVQIIGNPDLAQLLASKAVTDLAQTKSVALMHQSVFTQPSPSRLLN